MPLGVLKSVDKNKHSHSPKRCSGILFYKKLHPDNRHVRDKIRQQLQVLRDHGYLEFVSRGSYRLRQS